jgi:hypothetical protein
MSMTESMLERTPKMDKADKAKQVDKLLSSAAAMDRFIHELSYVNLDNCSGSAYRSVRLCRYDRGMLLCSEHSTFNYCHIAIASVPTAKIILGQQDSCYSGKASPSVDEGELVSVWSSGKWIKEGPWVPKIKEWLIELLEKLEKAREARRRKEEDVRLKKQQEQEEKDAKLIAAYS